MTSRVGSGGNSSVVGTRFGVRDGGSRPSPQGGDTEVPLDTYESSIVKIYG